MGVGERHPLATTSLLSIERQALLFGSGVGRVAVFGGEALPLSQHCVALVLCAGGSKPVCSATEASSPLSSLADANDPIGSISTALTMMKRLTPGREVSMCICIVDASPQKCESDTKMMRRLPQPLILTPLPRVSLQTTAPACPILHISCGWDRCCVILVRLACYGRPARLQRRNPVLFQRFIHLPPAGGGEVYGEGSSLQTYCG